MAKRASSVLAATLITGLCLSFVRVSAAPASLSPLVDGFIARSNLVNSTSAFIRLDHIALNRMPAARVLFTGQYHAEGSSAPLDNHPANLYYSPSDAQWTIDNADAANMPDGAAWNIFVPPQDEKVFTHTTTGNTNIGPRAIINYGLVTNGHPELLLFVAPVVEPPSTNVVTHTLAVAYDNPLGRWSVMNADGATMQNGQEFVVYAVSPSENTFTHITSTANHLTTTGTALNNPLINGNPDALLLITQNYGTNVTNSALNHRTAVYYDPGLGRWFILNTDGAPMPNGVMFNVLVIPPKTGYFIQTQSNIGGYSSRIDNPDLDNNPYARVYVMHNYNPAESENDLLDNHPVGVFYNSPHWYIYNRDFQSIAPGATFNVYYTWPRGNSFQVSADEPNSVTVKSMNLNSPQLDEHPNAMPIASYTKFAGGAFGADYTATVGFHYSGLLWRIFNNSGPAFGRLQSYNVLVPPPAASLVVTATNSPNTNFVFNWLFIDSPLTNGNPRALVFATPRDNSGIQPHNVGVFYYDAHWIIYNEDLAEIQAGQAFDVFIVPRFQALLPLVRR